MSSGTSDPGYSADSHPVADETETNSHKITPASTLSLYVYMFSIQSTQPHPSPQ
jgi:hypothetical protein